MNTLKCNGVPISTNSIKFGELESICAHNNKDIGNWRDRLEEQGYLYFKNFFDYNALEKAQNCVYEKLLEMQLLSPHATHDQLICNPHSPSTNGFLGDILHKDPDIQNFLYGNDTLKHFEALLGGEVLSFNYTWLRAMPKGKASYPHCDIVYMGRGTPDLLTMWVPYFDTPLELGGLAILEDSHKVAPQKLQKYLSHDVDSYCQNGRHAGAIESGEKQWEREYSGVLSKNAATLRDRLGGRWLTANYNAGDALIFGMNLVHCSLDNTTNQLRVSSDSRYQLKSEPADERWIGETPAGHGLAGKRGRIC